MKLESDLYADKLAYPRITRRELNHIAVSPFTTEGIMDEIMEHDTGWGSIAWTANLLIHVPITIGEPIVVAQFFWHNGAGPSGNSDAGIYDEAGSNKLVSTGSTANSGSSQLQVTNITDYLLRGGRYWLSFGCDDTSPFQRANPVVELCDAMGVKQHSGGYSSGLPSTATLNTPTVGNIPIYGFTGYTVV